VSLAAPMAIGIVGEVLFGMWNNRIQTELRRRSNERSEEASNRLRIAEEKAAARITRIEPEKFLAALSSAPLWPQR
jgi:hypothetical protein